jgi:hypothetical protein
MGGLAFATGRDALQTPRMPKPVYEAAKRRCHQILLQCYYCVATPIEGPGKTDFGDVDILVAWPKSDEFAGRRGLEEVARRLRAERVMFEGGPGDSAHVALPWPREFEFLHDESLSTAQGLSKDEDEDEAPQEPNTDVRTLPSLRHIQVDIRICASPSHLQWLLFKHAHGDMWNLLGSTIRPYGLTVDDAALWVRVPEIEASDRKRARVFLSDDPAETLAFLGLPVRKERAGSRGRRGRRGWRRWSWFWVLGGTVWDPGGYVLVCCKV